MKNNPKKEKIVNSQNAGNVVEKDENDVSANEIDQQEKKDSRRQPMDGKKTQLPERPYIGRTRDEIY